MRYANIVFFTVASILGLVLSFAAMWTMPFAVFTVSEESIYAVIEILKANEEGFNADFFYVTRTLEEVMRWGGVINFVVATICTVLAVMPALATVRLAEGKLFDRRVDRGWKMIVWMAGLGALVVAIYPAPIYIFPYIIACTTLISGYVITYQWPKKQKSERRVSNAVTA